MTEPLDAVQTRRGILKTAFALAGGAAVSACTPRAVQTVARAPVIPVPPPVAVVTPPPAVAPTVAAAPTAPAGVRPELFQRAMAALDRHKGRINYRDRIALVDFDLPSARRRFHFIDLENGAVRSLLVAHGEGSDPGHTGYLQRFSNDPGSYASSEGAYLTANHYVGQHGLSQRLDGLDYTNNNALSRAIVVHSAWYANSDMIAQHGKLGRSQGCFAVGQNELDQVFSYLGQGRMIYATKMA